MIGKVSHLQPIDLALVVVLTALLNLIAMLTEPGRLSLRRILSTYVLKSHLDAVEACIPTKEEELKWYQKFSFM